MASPNNSDYELITEHLGYPPVALLDDIINTVNVLADRALDSVEKLLLSIPPQKLGFRKPKDGDGDPDAQHLSPEDAARREIESGTHQLETLLTSSIDRNFDKLELYAMQNILTVQPVSLRPHMRLAHYKGLDFSDDGASDAESITALRRRVQASQRLNLALQRERARNEALLSGLRSVLGSHAAADIKHEGDGEQQRGPDDAGTLGFLHDKPALSSVGSSTPITTTTEFTLSQLTSLRALSTSLRSLLPDLAAPGEPGSPGPARSSWRRERAEYVEQSSRKYLENSGGLELGAQGEVRDGDYQGPGRNLGRDEVEGLERVVGMLGNRRPTAMEEEEEEEGASGEPMDES